MAYNFFDLGIKGSEVKRRLDLLKSISITDPIAVKSDLDKVSGDLMDALEEMLKDFSGNIDAGYITDYEW